MTENPLAFFAIGVLAVLSIGAISLEDNGIVFPDGSFQTTAGGLTASQAVQGKTPLLTIVGIGGCSQWTTLYSVPAGKRLVIEWLSVQGATLGATVTYPMDLFVRTHDGLDQVIHPLVRLENGVGVGIAFYKTQIWSGPVRLYSEASQPVQVRMCINNELEDQTVGSASFSGYLIDVP